MPITLRIADHPARQCGQCRRVAPDMHLRMACLESPTECKRVIQSSLGAVSETSVVLPSYNGFVQAAHLAYSNHHNLTIRPDEVWFTILTQLSFHINVHAEELRSFFVAHEGQKELEVINIGTIDTADFGKLAVWMTDRIQENVVDPELKRWIMPDFTTTTDTDLVTAAVIMMGTMKKYFSYKMTLQCGIPSVTLLGEKEDWVKIRNRLDFLPKFGKEPKRFAALLTAVLDYFVRSFDEPTSPEVLSFWSRIADQEGFSGPVYLSGWITAFCFWKPNGNCLYRETKGPVEKDNPRNPGCDLDGTLFHIVDTSDIPDAFVSVPVQVDDNGILYDTKMVAGCIGIELSSSGELLVGSDTTGPDTLHPISGWWIYEVEGGRGQ